VVTGKKAELPSGDGHWTLPDGDMWIVNEISGFARIQLLKAEKKRDCSIITESF